MPERTICPAQLRLCVFVNDLFFGIVHVETTDMKLFAREVRKVKQATREWENN